MEDYDGNILTRISLQLLPHVFVRPGELRWAEWKEFDLDARVWTIPGHKMKMGRPHAVPLSRQAIAIVREIEHDAEYSNFLFPSLRAPDRPMSDNTINAALRRLGYSKQQMTGHGFRAMAATLLNEMGTWNPDAIERQLAHADGYRFHRRLYGSLRGGLERQSKLGRRGLAIAGPSDHRSSPSPAASRLRRRSDLRTNAAWARERISGSGWPASRASSATAAKH